MGNIKLSPGQCCCGTECLCVPKSAYCVFAGTVRSNAELDWIKDVDFRTCDETLPYLCLNQSNKTWTITNTGYYCTEYGIIRLHVRRMTAGITGNDTFYNVDRDTGKIDPSATFPPSWFDAATDAIDVVMEVAEFSDPTCVLPQSSPGYKTKTCLNGCPSSTTGKMTIIPPESMTETIADITGTPNIYGGLVWYSSLYNPESLWGGSYTGENITLSGGRIIYSSSLGSDSSVKILTELSSPPYSPDYSAPVRFNADGTNNCQTPSVHPYDDYRKQKIVFAEYSECSQTSNFYNTRGIYSRLHHEYPTNVTRSELTETSSGDLMGWLVTFQVTYNRRNSLDIDMANVSAVCGTSTIDTEYSEAFWCAKSGTFSESGSLPMSSNIPWTESNKRIMYLISKTTTFPGPPYGYGSYAGGSVVFSGMEQEVNETSTYFIYRWKFGQGAGNSIDDANEIANAAMESGYFSLLNYLRVYTSIFIRRP